MIQLLAATMAIYPVIDAALSSGTTTVTGLALDSCSVQRVVHPGDVLVDNHIDGPDN
jgi:hypothetical protein